MPAVNRQLETLFALNLITKRIRAYLYFDGNVFVQFAPVVMSGTRTISFYVYFDDVSSTTSHYMYGNTEGYASRFVISYSGRFNIRANQSDNNSNFTEKSVFTSGIIHYVEVTITDTTCSVKVNGIEEYSETIPTADTYINLFGSNGTSVYGSFYLYDVSLNGERVYKLNEGAGRIVADSLNHDGAELVGAPTKIDANWTDNSDGSYTLNHTAGDGAQALEFITSANQDGNTYFVEVDVDVTTGGIALVSNASEATGSDGHYSFVFNSSLTNFIQFKRANDAVDAVVTVSNVSIKETTSGQINNYQDSLWNQGLPS